MDDGTFNRGLLSSALIYLFFESFIFLSGLLPFPSHLYIEIHTHHTPSFTVTILFTLVIACTLNLLCALNYSLFRLHKNEQETKEPLFLSQKFSCKTTRRKNPLFLRIQCFHSILQQKLRLQT